jgi:hypothetical protein
MTSLLHIACGEKEAPGQIKSEWLGAESSVYIPPHRLVRNRLTLQSRRLRIAVLLFSLCSRLAMGSCLTLFARGRFGSRHRPVGYGKRSKPFRVSREVAPCSESLVA